MPWVPTITAAPGGQEQSRVLGPDLSSYELDGLEPATLYRMWLSVLGPAGEGPPMEVTAYTGEPRQSILPPTDDPPWFPAPHDP